MNRRARFPAVPESVRAARRLVLDTLDDLSPDDLELLTLMVSELATNAVIHAGTEFEIRVDHDLDAGRVRIEAADRGGGRPTPRDPDAAELHGRGLQIVGAVATSWGVDWSDDGGEKVVWCELVVTPAVDRAAPRH